MQYEGGCVPVGFTPTSGKQRKNKLAQTAWTGKQPRLKQEAYPHGAIKTF